MNAQNNVFIGIGSNLDDPAVRVQKAITQIQHQPKLTLVAHSSIYRSAPLGGMTQPDYYNAVVKIETPLSPWRLLSTLQTLEDENGRQRGLRWGSRTLDLDILLFGALRHKDPRLELPHPGIFMRNFVLTPLAELEPHFMFPDGSKIAERMAECPATPIEALIE